MKIPKYSFAPARLIYLVASSEGPQSEKDQGKEKGPEKQEEKVERLIKFRARYSKERLEALDQCDRDELSKDSNIKRKAEVTRKKIVETTKPPEKIYQASLTQRQIDNQMRELYLILGKNWDKIREEEAKDQVEKDKEKGEKDKEAAKKQEEVRSAKEEAALIEQFGVWFGKDAKIAKSADTMPAGKYEIENVEPGRGDKVVVPKIYIPGQAVALEGVYSRVSGTRVTKTEADGPIMEVNGVQYAHIKGGQANDVQIKDGWVKVDTLLRADEKPVEVIKGTPKEGDVAAPEKIDKNKEVRGKVDEAVKRVLDSFANDDLSQPPKNLKMTLMNSIADALTGEAVRMNKDLATVEETDTSSTFSPMVVLFNNRGIVADNLSGWIDKLYEKKGVVPEDTKLKNTTKVISEMTSAMKAVQEKYEAPGFLKAETTYEDFLKSLEADTQAAINAAVTPQLLAKVEWDKLPDKTLTYPLNTRLAGVRIVKGGKPEINFSEPRAKALWDFLKKPKATPEETNKATVDAVKKTIAKEVIILNAKDLTANNIKNKEDVKKFTTQRIQAALNNKKLDDGTYSFVEGNITLTVKNGRASTDIKDKWADDVYKLALSRTGERAPAEPDAMTIDTMAKVKDYKGVQQELANAKEHGVTTLGSKEFEQALAKAMAASPDARAKIMASLPPKMTDKESKDFTKGVLEKKLKEGKVNDKTMAALADLHTKGVKSVYQA